MHATPATGEAAAVPLNPDDMTGRIALTLGGGGALAVTVRVTPAGLRAVGVLVSMILLSTAVVVRAAKRRA